MSGTGRNPCAVLGGLLLWGAAARGVGKGLRGAQKIFGNGSPRYPPLLRRRVPGSPPYPSAAGSFAVANERRAALCRVLIDSALGPPLWVLSGSPFFRPSIGAKLGEMLGCFGEGRGRIFFSVYIVSSIP